MSRLTVLRTFAATLLAMVFVVASPAEFLPSMVSASTMDRSGLWEAGRALPEAAGHAKALLDSHSDASIPGDGSSPEVQSTPTGQETASTTDYWAEKTPPAGTPRSLPARLFPADNWWNLNVSQAPVDPKSADYIKAITFDRNDVKLRYDWGNNYGIPYITVSGNYPKVLFQGGSYWSESDHVPYPIPLPALTEADWTEGGNLSDLNLTGDRHLLIVDVDNQYLYEIYNPRYNATLNPVQMPNGDWLQPGNFYCASAAMWDMKTNNTRPEGWTSSDAAGLQVLPGLVKYDEVMSDAPITHALRMTLNWNTADYPRYVWPATHEAGSWQPGNPPLGTRLRLKASKDISYAGPNARKILQALKDYGVIFVDNGGHGMISGTKDERWGAYYSPIRTEIQSAFDYVMLGDFEVIELGWRPTMPTINWLTPASVVQGTPLSPSQLAAVADVPGTFVYDPPAGTVLPVGLHTLTATFKPADSIAHVSTRATVNLFVTHR